MLRSAPHCLVNPDWKYSTVSRWKAENRILDNGQHIVSNANFCAPYPLPRSLAIESHLRIFITVLARVSTLSVKFQKEFRVKCSRFFWPFHLTLRGALVLTSALQFEIYCYSAFNEKIMAGKFPKISPLCRRKYFLEHIEQRFYRKPFYNPCMIG